MERSDPILVVGAGIGGLTLASLLDRRGFEVDLVERAPAFGAVGAGLMLAVNATSVLREVGCLEAIEAAGWIFSRGRISDSRDRTIVEIDGFDAKIGRAVAVHRAKLHEALADSLGGATLHLGRTVRSLEQRDDGVDVELSDGHRRRYGLVVGADGIRSATRDHVVADAAPRYAGYTSWRFVVPFSVDPPVTTEMWGRGKRFGIVPIGDDLTYCFATANTSAGERDPENGRVEHFRSLFSEFGGAVPEILRRLDEETPLLRTDIEEITLDRWSRGRVVLIGDAAHAMTPNLGQGAAMAIEDAYVLAGTLADESSVDEALASYERVRRPRVQAIADESRSLGRVGQWSWALACRARDVFFSKMPPSVSRNRVERLILHGAPAIQHPTP